MTHLNDDDLILHYYGEPEAAGTMTAHLAECTGCRERYVRLQRVMGAIDAMPAPVLPDGFERTVWARLEPALPKKHGWFSWLLATPPNLAWAATVVILIAGAFFAGRVSQQTSAPATATTTQDIREGVLLAALTEHLHRSQAMLVELVSAGETDAGDVDISLERDVAAELVSANRLYRQTASESGDATVTQLLEDLERLLVELAASPDQLSAEDMERVKQRITAKDLLFKVRVVSAAVREKQQQQIRARAGQSS